MSNSWPTNAERAARLRRIADDLVWDTHGKEDVSHLYALAERLLQDPDHREPPF